MKECPNCGFENLDNMNFCGNCGTQLQKVPLETPEDPAVSDTVPEPTAVKHTRSKVPFVCCAILAVLVFIGVMIFPSSPSDTPVELAQKNMAPHLEMLGKESKNGNITVSSEAFKTQNDVDLFGISGSTSCGLTSESATQIRWADWESNTNLSEEEFKKFLLHMNDYFGMEYEIKSYDKIPADEVYEWRGYSDTQYAICYYKSSKAYIRWYYTGEVTTPAATPTPKPTAAPTKAPTPEPVQDKEFIRENYGYVNYKDLARNPDDYKGKSLTYSGKVIQVIEGDSETQLRIAVNNDYDKIIYVAYPKDMVKSRILEDDYVTIFGTSLGVITYESTMGASITIPGVYLDRIELQ